jgi:Ion channel
MIVVLLTTCLITLLSVGTHYNALTGLSAFLRVRSGKVRRWVGISVLAILLVHILEVILFAVAYKVLVGFGDYGELTGVLDHDLSDYWYFSFVAYTSLGFGDIVPTHELRLMTALETLTGLILIAWSASFLFMQMHRFWEQDGG